MRGSIASQSHSTCVAQRRRVRSSSSGLVWEPKVAEEAFVQGLCVFPSASQPGDDGPLPVAEDSLSSGGVQPFGQREIRTMAICCEGVFNR